MTKQIILKELKREQAVRNRIWQKNGGYFVSRDHQQSYDTVQLAIKVFESMTDAEIERKVADTQKTTANTLF